MVACHAFMTFHYVTADKDDYNIKLSQKQLIRERKDYLVGILLHMWAQLALQVLFPRMFFPLEGTDSLEYIYTCAWATFLTHVMLVEPLYYAVHRWLHVPDQMKAMHGHHHMSVNTVPSTSLVQNFTEHFIYIATFGPAMILPYFASGTQHWLVVGLYLVMFDIVNAYGHTNYKCRHWVWESVWSPLRYAFYTPGKPPKQTRLLIHTYSMLLIHCHCTFTAVDYVLTLLVQSSIWGTITTTTATMACSCLYGIICSIPTKVGHSSTPLPFFYNTVILLHHYFNTLFSNPAIKYLSPYHTLTLPYPHTNSTVPYRTVPYPTLNSPYHIITLPCTPSQSTRNQTLKLSYHTLTLPPPNPTLPQPYLTISSPYTTHTLTVYKKPDVAIMPATQQDFVFLGHNGGLGHLLTIPEISMYNIYDPYWLSGTFRCYLYVIKS